VSAFEPLGSCLFIEFEKFFCCSKYYLNVFIIISESQTEKMEVFEGMLAAFETYFKQYQHSSLRRIEVLCLDDAEMKAFQGVILQKKHFWKR